MDRVTCFVTSTTEKNATANTFEKFVTIYQWTLSHTGRQYYETLKSYMRTLSWFSVGQVGMKRNALWCGQHILKLVVNHGMKRWLRTWSARKRAWYVTTVQDEECWPCINECDFMYATKQRPSITGWITFPVSGVLLCNLWFAWRRIWQRTICNQRACMSYSAAWNSHFSS